MKQLVRYLGGPLDGQILPTDIPDTEVIGGDSHGVYLVDNAAYDPMFNVHGYTYTPLAEMNTRPRPEVTVQGQKLMTLGQLEQFLTAARAAGYPDDHVPRVVNSFSGRIRALTAKE